MSCGPSAEWWDSHSCQKTNVCASVCVYVHVCVCGNCDEAKEWTYCPYCRPPLKRCTWLVGVCMCVYGTAVLQYYMGRVRGETQTNYSCGPGACGNCGLNNVGRESGARGRTREEEKRRDSLGKEAFTSWDKMRWPNEERTHGSEKKRHQRKEDVPLCRSALKQEKPQRPAGDVDRGIIWPQGHCRETWD